MEREAFVDPKRARSSGHFSDASYEGKGSLHESGSFHC